jgi:hypothetical protein
MPSSSITTEQLSIACCTVDDASPTAQRRVALADAFQPYFSIPTEVVTLESGLDEALDIVETSVTTLEMLRKLKGSTDTTTRWKRELLLDNADRLSSKLQARKLKYPTGTTTRRKRKLLLDNADRLASKLQARSYRAHCQIDEESDAESVISVCDINIEQSK